MATRRRHTSNGLRAMVLNYLVTMIKRGDYPNEFAQWLQQPNNQRIYVEFVRRARIAKRMQHRAHFSARAILEAIRWDTALHEEGSVFKINNNLTPYLARLCMEANPDLDGLFETRRAAA